MEPGRFFLAVILLVFALTGTFCQQNGQQHVLLYSASGCSGIPYLTIYGPTYNHTANASTIFYKVDGLYTIDQQFPNGSSISRHIIQGALENCVPLSSASGISLIFNRLGQEYQTVPQLHLYPQTNFLGTPEIYRQTANVTAPKNFLSYFFSGNSSWALYSQAGQQGAVTCRPAATSVINRGRGFTPVLSSNVTVGSVQLGCSGTTPPTSPTTTRLTSTTPRANLTSTPPNGSGATFPAKIWLAISLFLVGLQMILVG